MRKVNWVHDFLQDVRFGFRMLWKSPSFTAIAILTLALGIGANTAIFSVVDAVLLRPLPFHDAAQLVQLWMTEGSPGSFPLTGQDYLDWRAQNTTFQDMAIYTFQQSFNASGAGEAERAAVVQVQANYFSILGVLPILGRPFAIGEDQAGQNHVALLSYGFWQRHFGGGADAIEKSVELNGAKYSVVGVMPEWYRLPGGADLWVPIDASLKGLGGRGTHHLRALGRMKNGVTVEQARTDLKGIAARLEKQFPDTNEKESAIVIPLKEQVVGGARSELWVMFAAVGLVLLIACVNVANLLLVRSADRKREIAIRAAVGASRGRLVRQLLTESIVLSICGAIPGIALAYACVKAAAGMESFPIPQPNPVGANWAVLLFTLLVSVAIGVLFGMLPAVQTSQFKLSEDLKAGGKKAFTASARGRLVRDGLVAVEVGLSLALLAGAGLLLRTFADLRRVDIGVKTENVLTAAVQLPENRYEHSQSREMFVGRLMETLQAMPGVRAASASTAVPLQGGNNSYIQIDGMTDESLKNQLVEQNNVTTEYFHVLGIPLLQGRGFNAADMAETAKSANVMAEFVEQHPTEMPTIHFDLNSVINKAMADRFWPKQDPIGKVFRLGGDIIRAHVIGVVGSTRQWGLRTAPIPEAFYGIPFAMANGNLGLTLEVLSAGPPEAVTGEVRSAVRSMDSNLAVYSVRTIPQIVSDSMTSTNYQTFLLGALAFLALVLAAVGTYGVMSFVVTARTNEIGIRIALGAGRGQVLWMVLRQGLAVTAAGIAMGVAATLALTKLLQDFLYGVKPGDPLTLASVCGVMAIVALAACTIPAMRATRVDPSVALRYE
ncbi:MAG TPA: ABC transporter permease [Candidatus Acidoferrales bacterium]|jgi:putative ABC transport system permease protein|nr:ABC transporter permease [Candidatus Acidoferrales bacterium]